MVATAHILQVSVTGHGAVSDIAAYYTYGATNSSYYTQSHESPGAWWGTGAAALGLTGVITPSKFRHLLLGKTPDGRSQLVNGLRLLPELGEIPDPGAGERRGRRKRPAQHVPGYDITFSPPKSVSALWAFSDESTRQVIEQAFQESVNESLQLVEEHLALARRGRGGKSQQSAELVVAKFQHSTARNSNDPLLHCHCVVLNLCRGKVDGRWSKVNSQVLLRWVRTLGPLFRNTLALKLSERLGVEVYRPTIQGTSADWFELQGVRRSLLEKWSSRRQELLAEAELFQGKCSTAKARQLANLRTRRPKGARPQFEQLRQQWRSTAETLGQSLQLKPSLQPPLQPTELEKRWEQALKTAVERSLSERSYFSRHKLLQRVSEELQDLPISGAEVWKRLDVALQRPELFVSLRTDQSRERIYTTPRMWQMEQSLLGVAEQLRQRTGAVVASRRISQALKRNPDLSQEQVAAVRGLLESSGSLKCLTGVAGAGKTKTLNSVREAYEAEGYRVIGTALSGAAKEELARKGNIASRTIASYQHHLGKPLARRVRDRIKHHVRMLGRTAGGRRTWRYQAPKIDRRTVLIVDEAGMIDTKAMNFLLRKADQARATVILVGDDKQLNPIGPGGIFKRLIHSAPTFHLSENFRQRHAPADAQAAAAVREGEIEQALESFARRGCLTVSPTRQQAARALVTDWARDGSVAKPEEAVILTSTLDEARQINRLCQHQRQLQGKLQSRSVQLHGETFHVGDRVMFHEPYRRRGIENGYQATITAIHPLTKALTFRLDSGNSGASRKKSEVSMSVGEITSEFMTLGYAATTHKLQAQSRARAYCLIGSALTNRELFYVQITRGELATKLFTDRHHAGSKLSDLADSIRQSGSKALAHDLGLRLQLKREERGEHP